MSKLQFYEERYNRYLRKISNEYKLFNKTYDQYNYCEGNHSYTIRKPSFYKLFFKAFLFWILCVWLYIDVITDIYLCYFYAIQFEWSYFAFTLAFILTPVLINFANESSLLLPSRKYTISRIIAYRKTEKSKFEIALIFLKKFLLLDPAIKFIKFIKYLSETYDIQKKLYAEDQHHKVILNMVTQIEKPIKKRTKLREIYSSTTCQFVFETLPQLCLQLYIFLTSDKTLSCDIRTAKIFINITSVFIFCLVSSIYASFILSEIKTHIDINRAKHRKVLFILMRFISNLFFVSSRLISIVAALMFSKLLVLVIILTNITLSFVTFYFISLSNVKSFYFILNQNVFEMNYGSRIWQYFIFSTLKTVNFFEDIGINLYCYLFHGLVWIEILLMTCLFYFYSGLHVYLFIYVINGFLIGFLIENLLKRLVFNDKNSKILAYLEAYFLNIDAFIVSTEYETLQNDSLVFRV